MEDWSRVEDSGRDAAVRLRGVAGLGELRDAAIELQVQLLACEAGLRLAALDAAGLAPGVTVAGITTFLTAVGSGQMVVL